MKQSIETNSIETNSIETSITVVFNRGVDIITSSSVQSMTYKRFKSLVNNGLSEYDNFTFKVCPSDPKPLRRHDMLVKLGFEIRPANQYGYRFIATKTA